MTLLTDRLVLRPIEPGDGAFLLALSNRPGVREHLLPGQASEPHVERLVEQSVAHARAYSALYFGFIVLLRDAQPAPIGVCALTVTHRVRRTGTVGWDIDPDHSGRGYATEAGTALAQLAFGPCRLRRLRSDCYRDNAASRRVMEKVGLREDRTMWARMGLWWGYPDTRRKVRYGVSRSAWLRERSA